MKKIVVVAVAVAVAFAVVLSAGSVNAFMHEKLQKQLKDAAKQLEQEMQKGQKRPEKKTTPAESLSPADPTDLKRYKEEQAKLKVKRELEAKEKAAKKEAMRKETAKKEAAKNEAMRKETAKKKGARKAEEESKRMEMARKAEEEQKLQEEVNISIQSFIAAYKMKMEVEETIAKAEKANQSAVKLISKIKKKDYLK